MEVEAEVTEFQEAAFKKLYPEQYFDRWLSEGVRPDGRTLGRARATTVGLGAVAAANGSALVRQGQTAVLSGARATIMQPKEEAPAQGQLRINVEIAPFAVSDYRQGSAVEAAGILSARLNTLLYPLNLNQQLCIKEKKAAWQVELDVYVLNADGSVLDAALLSAVSTLMDLQLPPIKETKDGGAAVLSAADVARGEVASDASPRKLQLSCLPLALTSCLHKQHLLVDPTHEEEGIATATVTTIVDEAGNLHGLHKTGGLTIATPAMMAQCIEAAKLRHTELKTLLDQSLAAAAEQS